MTCIYSYRLNEKSPEEGDLVCYSRMSQTDLYDKTSSYKSHCDIVVKKTSDTIDVIGGNVNHTVGKKTVELNSDGTVKAGSAGKKWFTVIKTKLYQVVDIIYMQVMWLMVVFF